MNLRVLVVDDDGNTRQVLGSLLRMEGHEAELCSEASAALSLMQRGHYDLLLTDQVMPGMSGVELTREARALQSDIRCCVVSGQPQPAGILGEGIAWLSKPLDFDAFLHFLRS